jgi:hypothetical protein
MAICSSRSILGRRYTCRLWESRSFGKDIVYITSLRISREQVPSPHTDHVFRPETDPFYTTKACREQMQSDNSPSDTTTLPSSRYPHDEYTAVLEKAMMSAHKQQHYLETKRPKFMERVLDGKIGLVARWDHRRHDDAKADSSCHSPGSEYSDSVWLSLVLPEKAGVSAMGPVFDEESRCEYVSDAWSTAFGKTLLRDPLWGASGGPERVSLCFHGLSLPFELMKALSKRPGDEWLQDAGDVMEPYFNRGSLENATVPASSNCEAAPSHKG